MADAPAETNDQPKKTGKKVGRRPKLDDEMVARICGQIKKGNTIRTATVACGISQAVFYLWKATGEADRREGKTTRYSRFLDEVDHADAVAQQRLVARVLQTGTWKAALEILKRRWPKEFGDKTALTNPDGTPIQNTGGPPITVNFKFDNPEDDDPFEIDESALPPKDDDPPEDGKVSEP